jgi:FAD:protein FMN transferase
MIRDEFPAMGTTISSLLPAAGAADGAAAVRALFAEWERRLSRFLPDSELSRLNRRSGEPVQVSPLLFAVLTTAVSAARATGGIFDPTLLRQLVRVGYDRSFEEMPPLVPASPAVLHPGGGWQGLRMDATQRRVTLPAGVEVDLGGIAKGMAVDAALARLGELGITSGLVNAGGDLALLGSPPGGEEWPIAVPGRDAGWTVPLRRGAMATSGIAHRRWRQGTRRRHHLLDPRTGAPAESGLWSVTVVAGRCEQAEVAAKVAFILGPESGAEWLRARGLAGLLVCEDGAWQVAGPWPAHLMEAQR